MKDSARNTSYLRELLMNSADTLLYMDNLEAQKLAIGLFRYSYYKEGLKFGHNTFSQYFSTVFKNAFPEYANTLRDLPMVIGTDFRWDRLIPQIYANNPSLAPVINVSSNSYTDNTYSTINISSSAVSNPNSGGLQPYKYIQDMNDNLYRLNEGTAGNSVVTYNRIYTSPENGIYDINRDVNDMVTSYDSYTNKYSKDDSTKTNLSLDYSRANNLVSSPIEVYDSIDDILDYLTDFNPTVFNAEINEAKNAQEEKYSALEGLQEEGLKPCKK